jgi:nucleotide-binding universal stress UspA family protein
MLAMIARILVPVDLCDDTSAAVEYAMTLAEQFTASVELLHVMAPTQFHGLDDTPFVLLTRADAEVRMRNLVAKLRARGVRVSGRVECGFATEAILRAATESKHDLIVVGTHGRAGLAHLFKGSISAQVVRRAPCPVLTIRSEELYADHDHGGMAHGQASA